jgi:hypothetical protein
MRARCKITSLGREWIRIGGCRGESTAAERLSPSTSREIKRKRDELAKSSRERVAGFQRIEIRESERWWR